MLPSLNKPRIYVGRLDDGRPTVYVVDTAAVERLHPAGELQWGAHAGEATLELARVLLADAGGAEPPADACPRFAEQILARLPEDGFALQRDTISAWLRRYVAV